MRRHHIARAVLAAVLCAASLGAARAEPTCAPADHPGGDWPLYGHDLSGTRNQTSEHLIRVDNVGSLTPKWRFNSWREDAGGGFSSTPVVAGGCVYLGNTNGWVIAINADTGEKVWATKLDVAYQLGGPIFALAVAGGRVHANVLTPEGPRAVAFDALKGGDPLWTSEPIVFSTEKMAGVISSAIVWNGIQFVPTQGPDADPKARPGYAVVDAATGEIVHAETTIPVADLDRGYAGGGIWATPVVDETGYAYVGTANPYSKRKEHEYDNAILKFDLNEARPTFGTIVDAYKGNVDQYFPGLDRQPLCAMFGDDPRFWYHPAGFSIFCVQLDIDFGGSPTMFRNDRGRLVIAEEQKSGVVHAVFADTMQMAWTAVISVPPTAQATSGNASSVANDGETVYANGNPGIIWALDSDNGAVRWVAPVGDQIEYHPLAVANGVVYTTANDSALLGFEAATGKPLLARSMIADVGEVCTTLGGGVAIARNTVYAICDTGSNDGGWLVAYRLPS